MSPDPLHQPPEQRRRCRPARALPQLHRFALQVDLRVLSVFPPTRCPEIYHIPFVIIDMPGCTSYGLTDSKRPCILEENDAPCTRAVLFWGLHRPIDLQLIGMPIGLESMAEGIGLREWARPLFAAYLW